MRLRSGINHSPSSPAATLLLRWILRLRWVAAAGQLAAMLTGCYVFHLEIHWIAMAGALMITVLSNHLAYDCLGDNSRKCRTVINSLIFADSLILTVVLYFTGGTHNPFAAFYLLLIALAAMTLAGRVLFLLLAVVALEAAVITAAHLPFRGPVWVVADGRLTYQVFLIGWGASSGIIAICIAFFVHRMNRQLREREQALAEAENQVAEANRFQALATLAAGVAHELGSPLGTIAIASKDLERSLHKNGAAPELREDASLIRSEVDRCRQILDRLDRRSTRRTGEAPEPCTAAVLCQRLEKHLKPAEFGRLRIDDRTAGFPLVLSTGAVLQALVVLIENACEADASGKPVMVDIRVEGGRNVVFRILDSGPGIPESVRKRVGEPFFTTKKDQSGMGLGIFLVQTLTEHLGGSCSLLPATNGGTCAVLTLPVEPSML